MSWRGGTRQASFTASTRQLRAMGITRRQLSAGVFEAQESLALGPLREDRPLVVVGAAGDQAFGGMRIDGLISHAFLKRFAWTIDFDSRQYMFHTPRID
jgi:hypothetical protein